MKDAETGPGIYGRQLTAGAPSGTHIKKISIMNAVGRNPAFMMLIFFTTVMLLVSLHIT